MKVEFISRNENKVIFKVIGEFEHFKNYEQKEFSKLDISLPIYMEAVERYGNYRIKVLKEPKLIMKNSEERIYISEIDYSENRNEIVDSIINMKFKQELENSNIGGSYSENEWYITFQLSNEESLKLVSIGDYSKKLGLKREIGRARMVY